MRKRSSRIVLETFLSLVINLVHLLENRRKVAVYKEVNTFVQFSDVNRLYVCENSLRDHASGKSVCLFGFQRKNGLFALEQSQKSTN